MDTDVLYHGNLDFTPDEVSIEKDGSVLINCGERVVLIYLIHKNVLNAVDQMHSLKIVP